ncbi:MAG: hypothetical protein EXX96DRAFT_483217 [Benjaminiella poitrasii]|nr:MAG: hypothetical protein EXX96DRAFT_483217 [Benjaminiella poitrasii]
MVLPNSEHFSSVAGFKPKPTNHPTRPKSYAQAVASPSSPMKMSLLHNDLDSTTSTDKPAVSTLVSRIYRSSGYRDAFLLDISKCTPTYTEAQCMQIVKQQHPRAHACIARNDGPKRYFEVYITPLNDINDILRTGVVFDEIQLTVLPCTAVVEQSHVVTLKLSRIPLFTDDLVHAGLQQSLSVFGRLLDFGVYKDKNTDFFMGNGYAVLDTYQADDVPTELKYATLSHQLSWCESTEEFFLATWNNMPTWCRYCHKDGHTKFECELSRARILCYGCHHYGHRSFECPRRNHSPTNKKKDRKSYQTRTNTTLPNTSTNPSVEQRKVLEPAGDANDSDNMSTSDDDHSLSEDDQMFRDNVVIAKEELQTGDEHQIVQLIHETQTAGAIASRITEDGKVTWSVVERTPYAVALVDWITEHNFSATDLSNTASGSTSTPPNFGDYRTKSSTNQL